MIINIYPCQTQTSKTLVFSSGLGGHANFWQPQIEFFTEFYNVLCYDQDGVQPDSEPLPNDYHMADLGTQLIQILSDRNLSQCHFVGHALGGFIGIEVAKQAPELLDKLVILNGWDKLNAHTEKCFSMRRSLLENTGIEAFVRAQAVFLYPPIWISNNIGKLTKKENNAIENFAPIENMLKRLKALREYQPLDHVNSIIHPTLVLSNLDDVLVPWQCGMALAQHMQQAQFELMLSGGHASTVSEAPATNQKILNFLTQT